MRPRLEWVSSPLPWMQANGVQTLNDVNDIFTTALAKGGSADVYKATWRGRQVVLKVFRGDPKLALKKLLRELKVWRLVRHAHIQELLGVRYAGDVPTLVSPFYEFTNLHAYFHYCRGYMKSTWVDVLKTELLCGVLLGLDYLHTQSTPIIHGDIKAANIFVTENGTAVIGDFGTSVQAIALHDRAALRQHIRQCGPCNGNATTSTSISALRGTLRWMAPELITEDNPVHTIRTDIWA
ncbi:kinase-like protein, partial [Exidia glandulosa HHB12029]